MTQATNTFDRVDLGATGQNVREQLSDIVSSISHTETPFLSNVGKMTAKNSYVEWLGDELAAATSNKQIDGDEFAGPSAQAATTTTPSSRISPQIAPERSSLSSFIPEMSQALPAIPRIAPAAIMPSPTSFPDELIAYLT